MNTYYNVVASEGGWNGTSKEWVIESYSDLNAATSHAKRLRLKQEPHHLITYDIREINVR